MAGTTPARHPPNTDGVDVSNVLDGLVLSRRQLLQAGSLGAVALALGACTPEQASQIANRPMRMDIVNLGASDPMVQAYGQAIQAMKNLPSSDRRNWINQANIHRNFCPHGNWLFLPWHRAYLKYFEDICRQLSGKADFALPYWNWQKDRQVPSMFWDPASPLYEANRVANASTTLPSSIFGASNIQSILDEDNFLVFASGSIPSSANQRQRAISGPFESGPHDTTHVVIGGLMGGFSSPQDPVFWTHHNVIDAIWVDWNIRKGNPNTNDRAWIDRRFTEFCDKDGNPVDVSVLETILYPYFTYRFDDPVLGV
jgi:tyrosinase